jgi:hypothetical protein
MNSDIMVFPCPAVVLQTNVWRLAILIPPRRTGDGLPCGGDGLLHVYIRWNWDCQIDYIFVLLVASSSGTFG